VAEAQMLSHILKDACSQRAADPKRLTILAGMIATRGLSDAPLSAVLAPATGFRLATHSVNVALIAAHIWAALGLEPDPRVCLLALVHDAIFAIGFTSLAGAIVPKSWGLSFDMSLNTLAAVLTVIGFSINDTIVVFDRIRENLALMKKATFAEIINASVNQTLSRTIITAFTVWISVVVLYLFTATTGGGIAEFSFPLIMGVIAGTYSTVYIAAPIVLWWYKGQKPASS